MTAEQARSFAQEWIAAWNAHDLDAIMQHYDDSVELTSPAAANLLGLPDGKVIGKADVRAYFERGLEAFPSLKFHLDEVLSGLHSLVLYYINHKNTHTAEFMELSPEGKVTRVVANYSL